MPGPLAILALTALGGIALSAIAKKNPARTGPTDGTIASGVPYLPAEAFTVVTDADSLDPADPRRFLVGAIAFTDPYGEIGGAKLLRYKVTSSQNRILPGGGGQVTVVQAKLAFRKSIASDGLPPLIDDTALGVVRGKTGAGAASRGLALVPNGIPASALTFRSVMDDLRLFPDTVTLVIGDPAVIRTLTTGVATATNTALGVSPDISVIAANVESVGETLPTTTQELLNSMAES